MGLFEEQLENETSISFRLPIPNCESRTKRTCEMSPHLLKKVQRSSSKQSARKTTKARSTMLNKSTLLSITEWKISNKNGRSSILLLWVGLNRCKLSRTEQKKKQKERENTLSPAAKSTRMWLPRNMTPFSCKLFSASSVFLKTM
jgi:hypothetical protein